ncbi:ral guanine nucleotide dissociation stimulator-like [Octodon degus]|uniref:Ral guanine nucleotide dissociation stimulator-like n=1 Tax=Octodon degus TaxID=10160 RepID=A0A6P6DSZ8_OCTDE|nr:ral guanine nucleotide dissociation stimulator-like [Octodon degus]
MQQVPDLLLQRCVSLMASVYGQSLHHSSKSGRSLDVDQLKNAISTIFGMWLENYADQFNQPPKFACLKQLLEYVQVHMPGSDLEHRVYLLLMQLEDKETKRAMTEYPGQVESENQLQQQLPNQRQIHNPCWSES